MVAASRKRGESHRLGFYLFRAIGARHPLGVEGLRLRPLSPTETLHDMFKTVDHLLAEPQETPSKLLTAIRSVVNDRFDVREAARLALGREWKARTSTERDEFVELFGDLLERTYISTIASRANVHGGLTIRYLGESLTETGRPSRPRLRGGMEARSQSSIE